jgi:hypothetical protein
MEAIRRGRASLLSLTARWIAKAPTSFAARVARARAVELSGNGGRRESVGGSNVPAFTDSNSALGTLALAARLSQRPADSLGVLIAATRVRLRAGDFEGAARSADSGLVRWETRRGNDAALIAPLAALRGNEDALARLVARSSTSPSGQPEAFPQWLATAYGNALAASALVVCGRVGPALLVLDSGFVSHFSPSELTRAKERWLQPMARLAMPCMGMAGAPRLSSAFPTDRAMQAWARGDIRTARTLLDSLAKNRGGANAAAISWDQEFAEDWLLVQIGDTLVARSRLENAVRDLNGMSEYTLDFVQQAAGLRNGLRLLGKLSPRSARDISDYRVAFELLDKRYQ